MTQFRTLFSLLLIFSASVGYSQDYTKTLTIPLFVADSIIADLERLDNYKILTDSLTRDKSDLKAIIRNDSSIHAADSLNRRTLVNLSNEKEKDKTVLKQEIGIEKKKRVRNGVERDIGIGLILLLAFVIVKP